MTNQYQHMHETINTDPREHVGSAERGYQEQMYAYQQQPPQQPPSHYIAYVFPASQEVPLQTAPVIPKLMAVGSYAFGWLTGLLFLLLSGGNHYVRFHALQSIFFFGAINVIDLVMIQIGRYDLLPRFAWPFFLLFFLVLNFVAFAGWIIAMIQASNGKYYHLPIAGNIASGIVGGAPAELKP